MGAESNDIVETVVEEKWEWCKIDTCKLETRRLPLQITSYRSLSEPLLISELPHPHHSRGVPSPLPVTAQLPSFIYYITFVYVFKYPTHFSFFLTHSLTHLQPFYSYIDRQIQQLTYSNTFNMFGWGKSQLLALLQTWSFAYANRRRRFAGPWPSLRTRWPSAWPAWQPRSPLPRSSCRCRRLRSHEEVPATRRSQR